LLLVGSLQALRLTRSWNYGHAGFAVAASGQL